MWAAARRRCQKRKARAASTCTIERNETRAQGNARIEAAAAQRREKRRERIELAANERRRKEARRGDASAKVRQQESDDEVRGNLEPHEIPLFEEIKRQIKATARMSRTGAFHQYVHEHPQDLFEAQEAALEDDDYAKMAYGRAG